MSELSLKMLEYYQMIADNLETYGRKFGEPDKESGRGFVFDDRKIQSFFNTDKTALLFFIFIQDHETASFSLSIKSCYYLMRLIGERIEELAETEGKA